MKTSMSCLIPRLPPTSGYKCVTLTRTACIRYYIAGTFLGSGPLRQERKHVSICICLYVVPCNSTLRFFSCRRRTSLIPTNKKDDIPRTEQMIYSGSYVAGQLLLKGMHMRQKKYVKQVKLWQFSSA